MGQKEHRPMGQSRLIGGREVSGQFVSDIAVLQVTHSTSG